MGSLEEQKWWKLSKRPDTLWYKIQQLGRNRQGIFKEVTPTRPTKPVTRRERQVMRDSTRRKRAKADSLKMKAEN